MKSVIAYPENCQSCGQCYVGCQGRSLQISYYARDYLQPAIRAAATDSATPETASAAIVQKLYDDQAAAEAEAAGEGGEGGEGGGSGGWGK